MSPESHPNRARPIMTPTPEFRAEMKRLRKMGVKPPTADEIRESIRKDAKRLLTPLYKKIALQRGLPTDGGRIGGPDDLYCHPKPGSWIESF